MLKSQNDFANFGWITQKRDELYVQKRKGADLAAWLADVRGNAPGWVRISTLDSLAGSVDRIS